MAKKILLADDEVRILRLAQLNLERVGYTVVTAADGYEAVARARTEKPDAIILDVMMPNMDGFAALDALKADPETRDIPVIMLTAMTKDADIIQGTSAGAAIYLAKPFNPMELLQSVRIVLGEAHAG
ncbi:MAG TPA: response regulator [Chthonomonadales bacterium]|nr:response regulator [Chthonomonadales bacterium]